MYVGGLSSSDATAYLSAVNALRDTSSAFSRLPALSFSFGRALQGEAVQHWIRGDEEAVKKSFEEWSRACWAAAKGG